MLSFHVTWWRHQEAMVRDARQDLIRKAIEAFTEADNSLGSGTDFTMGAANLLFWAVLRPAAERPPDRADVRR